MLTDEQVQEQHEDAEMMRRPHIWPYQLLPCKQRVKGLPVAVLTGVQSNGSVVLWNANYMEVMLKAEPGDTIIEAIQRITAGRKPEAWRYESPEAAIADSWVVD